MLEAPQDKHTIIRNLTLVPVGDLKCSKSRHQPHLGPQRKADSQRFHWSYCNGRHNQGKDYFRSHVCQLSTVCRPHWMNWQRFEVTDYYICGHAAMSRLNVIDPLYKPPLSVQHEQNTLE